MVSRRTARNQRSIVFDPHTVSRITCCLDILDCLMYRVLSHLPWEDRLEGGLRGRESPYARRVAESS